MRYLDEITIIGGGGALGTTVNQGLIIGTNVITHGLGVQARQVEVLVAGVKQIFPWEVGTDPLNEIDITVDEIEAAVEINIIGY